ncbi:unnamed protein product [Cuscuta europaea]|uniref:Replication protein A 70 kDa DNA-binding subunit B/D first OB fold domain-containing protein n=1 Tax=Cuscuta europaea TaxID=41803 RepID=A0A9P0ZGR9_CUSEU|nr:unnamed protein product [Cuscuta europaea]
MMTAPFLHAHSEGNKIQASIRKTLIYRFHKELKEDDVYSITNFGFASNSGAFRGAHHEYKLSFQYGTRKILTNVIAMCTDCGDEKEYERNGQIGKMRAITLESNGYFAYYKFYLLQMA